MLPEQQQRILGYFIEEAKDHLVTIEQGLLNLQTTLQDSEMVNELFRAAHSVKGGAAMLGISSILRIAHRFEDFFKILKESPNFPVNRTLESLLLKVFDTLRASVEHLERATLNDETASALMSKIEPVFTEIDQHLAAESRPDANNNVEDPVIAAFQNDVPLLLRQMLELFKQPQSSASTQQLQEYCQQLINLGAQFGLPGWIELCQTAAKVLSNPQNTYRTLAPVVITELKQAQELVAAGYATAIIRGEQWQSLLFTPSLNIEETENEAIALDLFEFESTDRETTDLFALELNTETPDYLDADAQSEMFALDNLFTDQTTIQDPSTQFNFTDLFEDNSASTGDAQQSDSLWDDEVFAPISEEDNLFAAEDDLEAEDSLEQFTYAQELENTNPSLNDEFDNLDKLLEQSPVFVGSPTVQSPPADIVASSPQPLGEATPSLAASSKRGVFEQMMRVPVKHLDNISNLVGELVVYRNSLEQDQLRLRQFLDNLLSKVQQLSEVGFQMQELYERSLLQSSLTNRKKEVSPAEGAGSSNTHSTGIDFDALEMDRFTGFHTLTQQMIELIVRVRESSSDIEFVTDETDQVARQFRQVTTQLQEGVTQSRMVTFTEIAGRLPRAVRDISLKCGKEAELIINGQDTLIDKVLLEQLYDPMTHLVNNAIAHGIESPEVRTSQGKSPIGKITVQAFYQGNQTVISVTDDGAGIDTDKVLAKAIQKGLISPEKAQTMARPDIYNLLFHPGFSIKDTIDEFAGRGIGMDVVQTSLTGMRGSISTDSTLGSGTTFTIRLPLTLSICKALCCLSDKARIAFPMDGVEQMIELPIKDIVTNAQGETCLSWRDNSLLPFRHLKELLTYNRHLSRGSIYGSGRSEDTISLIVLRSGNTFMAVQVDQVLGEQEIVIKQFEAPAPKPLGVSGATVMGDGRIMPIADVLELMALATGRLQREPLNLADSMDGRIPIRPVLKTEPMVLIVDDSITVRELLSMTFNNAGYRTEQARDGQEAWDKLNDGLPCDIVFCDIEMPRMDGLELLSRIHESPNFKNLPIAMLTSRGSDRHRQMAVQLGASGYFIKPYLEEALLDAAQRMIKGEVLVTAPSSV
ncbi:hybrid sensor histidine kinase/response regulator [Chlorogloea sp. CCALA 695]|uniref:hybrid sensor histidine kinase/response regulator n=1 Tax=Chlorogloea sp. CCALA 695 TaxID=2107693 RepID=UPI000D0551DB|nr:hybrid sensor histidine kinase/response regulator [Chlorogloea sp. CCALA 695]PSB32730.1 hybrid sensor histidine kinase/response regulator [Chlorogloea sp. CCALA 695]